MAVMAEENINVEQLLRINPTAGDLFYLTESTYEECIENTNGKKRENKKYETNAES